MRFASSIFVIVSSLLFISCGNERGAPDISNEEKKALNFVIIFADDLGYGDLSSYGNPTINTPNLDRMATEGQKWTNFYSGASVCTPSRAALLTGRLPVRSGMASNKHRVLFPDSKNGLPASEITLAEQLKTVGYQTAAIGKWHLGHKEEYLPTNHGFDYYFGIPYSNDMDMIGGLLPYWEYWQQPNDSIKTEHFNVPLFRNTEIIERPANQHSITKRYSEETVSFIRKNKDQPFFVYLAHNLPHIPLFVSAEANGKSERGLYGDVVEEIDNGVGKILTVLEEEGLAENTIVVFTSDNGPWLSFKNNGGSAGLLRAGKGTTWEGGMREPGIFWGPGNIKPGLITDLGSTMDLFTTFSSLAGAKIPDDHVVDGVDLSETLLSHEPSPRKSVLYYRGTEIYAARLGDFKVHYVTQGAYGELGERQEHETPILYNLSHDAAEKFDISQEHPEILKQIQELVLAHKSKLEAGKDQLAERE
ncbi:sulfatase [Maribacter algarum]|uniref:Sulfatase n=1 Tax=Maribacter algarum (ex Zhang et al. 2020) TaxID=2578118 RepID=A0A5S3PTU5_9FLAO|nr:sulfatase [Maribacter algarum]TMM58393.1 sulfatase [Maribacter algarum]